LFRAYALLIFDVSNTNEVAPIPEKPASNHNPLKPYFQVFEKPPTKPGGFFFLKGLCPPLEISVVFPLSVAHNLNRLVGKFIAWILHPNELFYSVGIGSSADGNTALIEFFPF